MGGFLNRELAQAEEENKAQIFTKTMDENVRLRLRVEILEGLLEQYAVRQAQLETALLVATAKEEAMRGEPNPHPASPFPKGKGEE